MSESEALSYKPEQIQININSQYIKDFSFENPNAPEIFSALSFLPETKVGVNVQSRPLAENTYETTLMLKLEAKIANKTAFVVELSYAGVFSVPPIPEESLRFVLLVEAPRLLFPFARNIIANAIRDGGFPPLLINPIDFATMYYDRSEQLAKEPMGTA